MSENELREMIDVLREWSNQALDASETEPYYEDIAQTYFYEAIAYQRAMKLLTGALTSE